MRFRSVAIALFAGFILGGGVGVWGALRFRPQPPVAVPEFEETPEDWLVGPGTTFEKIYPDELIRAAIMKPDQVEFHLAQENGPLQVEEWRFSAEGRTPDQKTVARLIYGLQSVNSYRGLTTCEFSPGVLVRLTKDGKAHDLLFCFKCSDLRWTDGGIGMSKEGIPVFLKCFADAFPDSAELKGAREQAARR